MSHIPTRAIVVPFHEYDAWGTPAHTERYHGGSVGSPVEVDEKAKAEPRRPIGFRMPPPEPPPPSPDWMLL